MVARLLLWCLWMAALGPAPPALADSPNLCLVGRLASPALSARQLQRVSSSGCFSRRVTPRGQEVHVVRLSAPRHARRRQGRRRVTLNVLSPTDGSSYSREIIIVLASSAPVDWIIHDQNGFKNGTSFQIIVTKRSRVVHCDLSPYTVKSQRVRGREALLKFVLTRLQAVTSFSGVGAVDAIDLTVGINLSAPDTCDTQEKSQRPSAGLVARVSRPVPLVGCYHHDLAGLGQRDVYMVEVTDDDGSAWNSRVVVNLLPAVHRKSASGNLTLILKSAVGVTWELTSDNYAGDLLVLTDGPVKEGRLGSAVVVETRLTGLPSSFTSLMLFAVKYSSGPPVAYVRVPSPSQLDIRLGGGTDDAAGEVLPADDAAGEVLPADDARSATELDAAGPALADDAGSPSGQLRRAVSVACSAGVLTVAVPSSAAAAVSVSTLHLDDWGCVSRSNGSHLVVSGPLSQCGTGRRTDRGRAEYVNTVHFVSSRAPEDDEDFEGSGGGASGGGGGGGTWTWSMPPSGGSVPLSCTPPEGDTHGDHPPPHKDITLDADGEGSSIYKLELALDSQFTRPIKPNLLVPVSDSIYVRATLFMASYLVPVVEQCWVSGTAGPAGSPSAGLTLVAGSCPALSTVSRLTGTAAGYRIQVTRAFADLGPYYLHCRVGVCAGPNSPARQHIVECLDNPRNHCPAGPAASSRRLSSGVQVITRGPLLSTQPVGGANGESAGRWPLLQQGVSHETVAGIGVAAFLLGVLLMGGVWLIHTKIGPSKRHHFQAVPQSAAAEPAGGQSANSTPNSQTPIIVAGRAPAAVGV